MIARLLLAWLLVTAVGYGTAPRLAAVGAPLVVDAFRFIHPDLLVELQPLSPRPEKLGLNITVVQAIRLDAERAIPGGSRLTLETGVLHALLPSVLLLVLSLALPVGGPGARVATLLLALMLGLLLAGTLLLAQWTGLLELNFQSAAEQAGIARDTPWSVELLIFLEGGARWIIALALGGLPAWLVGRYAAARAVSFTKLSSR